MTTCEYFQSFLNLPQALAIANESFKMAFLFIGNIETAFVIQNLNQVSNLFDACF